MSFTIKYYSNNGKGNTISKTYATPCYLETDLFETDGFVLHSWNTKANGTGTTYDKHKKINTDAEGTAIGGKLYAIWKIANEGQIRIKNGNVIVDISDMYDGVYKVFGKNQPYNYVTLQILKNLFNDTSTGGYWWARQQLHPGDPSHQKPELIQRETKILVDVYGIRGEWLFEKIDENNDTAWKITAVSQSYYMKTTTLENLLTFEPTISSTGELTHVKFTKIDNTKRAVTSLGYGRYSIQLNVEYRNRVNVYVSSEKITIYFDATQTPSVERVTGTGTAIFAFIAKYCCGFTGSNTSTKRIFIDDGFIYDFTNGTYSEVQSSYTQLEIEQIKGRAKLPLSGTVMGRTYDAMNVELRADEYCSTIVGGLCALSNRYAFFDEDAYFVDYQVTVGGVRSEILQSEFTDPKTYDYADKIKIDWGGDNTVKDGYFVPELMGLSTNADQGSQYILQSQKVISESYERTVVISDSLSTISGSDIKYMYREHASNDGANNFTFDTATRNFQTSIIALNQIVNWYKPGDCIAYNMCETKQQYTYTVESYAELIATYPAGGNDKPYTALVLGPTDFKGKVYKGSWDGSAWVWGAESDYTGESYATLERDARYKIYSVASEVKDIQNDFTLTNVPLSGITISYPSCVTSYFWGNPYFMDEESEFSDMSAITSDSTLDNTSDTQISDNYAAKIVVGNQSLAELADDRKGYTGLILEKNWDAELYRLAGYENGKVQAQFNTKGKITAGGGNVVLDETGVKTYHSEDVGKTKWVAWMDTDGAFLSGNLSGGSGKKYGVSLDDAGLSLIFDSSSYSSPSAINFYRYNDTQRIALSRIYSVNTSDAYAQATYFESISDTPIRLKTQSDRGSTTTTYKFMSDSEPALISTSQYKELENNVTHYAPQNNFWTFAAGGVCQFRRMTNPTPWSEAQSPSQTIIGSSSGNIGLPAGIVKMKVHLKVYRDSGQANSIYLKFAVLNTSGGEIASREISTTGGPYEEDFVVDLTGMNAIKGVQINTRTDHDSFTRGWFYVSDLVIWVTSAQSGAELILDPLGAYSFTDENTYLQIQASTRIGTSSSDMHHFHGRVQFHDGYVLNGNVEFSDEALTTLADKLRPKLGL